MLKIQEYEQDRLLLYRDIWGMSQILGLVNNDSVFDDIAQFGKINLFMLDFCTL